MKAIMACLAAVAVLSAAAWTQAERREPRIGYLYPAGGQAGTTVQAMAGGLNLRSVTGVHITGTGVDASVVRYMGRTRRLNGEERRELRRRLDELAATRRAPAGGEDASAATEGGERRRADRAERGRFFGRGGREEGGREGRGEGSRDTPIETTVSLPRHPLLDNLADLSLWELEFVENEFLRYDAKEQPNAQIAETVLIEVRIDPGAEPGDRELRLQASAGLTNPFCFQIGQMPEVREPEPYDPGTSEAAPLDLPVLLNGQIRPGDVDLFRFSARTGQNLVIQTHARRLVPYLADAVPGWFQAVVAVFDAGGGEAAFADDFRYEPDPVILFQVPATGIYALEVRDALYRGREDFVYRISIAESPFITSLFPLGGRAGSETTAEIGGWNLAVDRLSLDTRPGADAVRRTVLCCNGLISNPAVYAVDDLPECIEHEPNEDAGSAQLIEPPVIVNGRVAACGDQDVFRFAGRAGDEIVCEVQGRLLGSPLDSLVEIADASGGAVAWNDDFEVHQGQLRLEMGAATHHADSYLRARLPRTGDYFVRLADAQNRGGEASAYRLRISGPRPDFAVYATPSSLSLVAGFAEPVRVHVVRRDGFEGDIDVCLKDPPPGLSLQGGRIPAGCDSARMTLFASGPATPNPFAIELEGRALIDNRTVRRPAFPADNVMQAFLYRHLLPSQELVAVVAGGKNQPPFPEVLGELPVRIRAGGSVEVRIAAPRRPNLETIRLELNEPPAGVTLHDVRAAGGELSFVLRADRDLAQPGEAGNLIIDVYVEREARREDDGKEPRKQSIRLGVLPAIPFGIVKR